MEVRAVFSLLEILKIQRNLYVDILIIFNKEYYKQFNKFLLVFAFIGIVLKLFYTGRYDKLSTVMYILMGWQIIFVIKPLIQAFSMNGLQLLFAGGVFYTVGALLYSLKKIQYNHAIFHVFVLLGSACHYICIYKYILPI